MLTTLLESGPRRVRPAMQGIFSVAFHLALGVGAIEATKRTVVPEGPRIVDTIVIPIGPEPEPADPAPRAPLTNAPGPVPADPIFVAVPTEPIIGIPPFEPNQAIDPRRFVVGPARAPECLFDCRVPVGDSAAIYREALVDEPAGIVAQPAPVYPPILQAAGIEGRVILEFVVDTLGTVEPLTVRVAEASHPGFERSARESVLGARFTPARIGGGAVRQLVRQGVSFRIGR